MSQRTGDSHLSHRHDAHHYVTDAGRYEWFKKARKVEVHCTPAAVETALRHRKETEMPNTISVDPNWSFTMPPKTTESLKEVLPRLMTPQQVKSRLQSGEDPLLLSIEHWLENAVHVKEHGSLPSASYQGDTCALCATHRGDGGGCKQCLLGISQGGGCSRPSTAWTQFVLNPTYDNAMNMVAVLASLKPPEPQLPQFCIHGEGEGKVALRLEQGRDGKIDLRATTKDDSFWYYLLEIRQDGGVRLISSVSSDLGLDLDDQGRLRIEV